MRGCSRENSSVRARGLALALLSLALCCARSAPARVSEVPAPVLDGVEQRVREKLVAAQRLVEARRDDPAAWGAYGMVLDAHRQTGRAEIAYREARRLDPDDFRWTYHLAGLLDYKDPKEAAELFEDAVTIDPDYGPARVRYGETLEKLGRLDAAEEQFRRATRLTPDDPLAWFGLGRSALARGELEVALEYLERAYAIDRGVQAITATLSRALFRAGEAERARELAQRARSLPRMTHHSDPRRAAVRDLAVDSESYLQRSRTYQEVGALDRALSELETLARLEPDRADVHLAMAGLYDRMRRPAEAVAAARRALAADAELPGARAVLAGALLKLGRFAEARSEAERVLAAEPDNFHMLLVSAMAGAQTGDIGMAVQQVDRAFEARTGDPELRDLLRRMLVDFGESFLAVGRREEGLERLERALALDRESGLLSPSTRELERRIRELRSG